MPGTIGVYVPLLLARGRPAAEGLIVLFALALLALGGAIYAWCVWDFAVFGRVRLPQLMRRKGLWSVGYTAIREIPSTSACLRCCSDGPLCSKEGHCLSTHSASGLAFTYSSSSTRSGVSRNNSVPSTMTTVRRSVAGCRVFAGKPSNRAFESGRAEERRAAQRER